MCFQFPERRFAGINGINMYRKFWKVTFLLMGVSNVNSVPVNSWIRMCFFHHNSAYLTIYHEQLQYGRSRLPHGLKCGSAVARLLRLWVTIPSGARMSVCCECFVLSGRGLCDEMINCPEESYRLWRVVMYNQTSCE
jgi:hypothetical protein